MRPQIYKLYAQVQIYVKDILHYMPVIFITSPAILVWEFSFAMHKIFTGNYSIDLEEYKKKDTETKQNGTSDVIIHA